MGRKARQLPSCGGCWDNALGCSEFSKPAGATIDPHKEQNFLFCFVDCTMPETTFRTAVSSERRRMVFLVGRTIFRRSTRPIDLTLYRKIVGRNAHKLDDLNEKYGKDSVNNILWSLVEKGVFQSKFNAKRAFPELYPEVQHEVSERNPAKAEAEMLEKVGNDESLDKEFRDEKPISFRLQRLLQGK